MRMAAFWPTRSPTGEVVKVGFRVDLTPSTRVCRVTGNGATSPLPCLSAKVPSPPDLQTFAIVR
jgi:hypothetical protein